MKIKDESEADFEKAWGTSRWGDAFHAALRTAAAQRELDELCGFCISGTMTREESAALARAAAAALLGDQLGEADSVLVRLKRLSGLKKDEVVELMMKDASSLADCPGGPRRKLFFAVQYKLNARSE